MAAAADRPEDDARPEYVARNLFHERGRRGKTHFLAKAGHKLYRHQMPIELLVKIEQMNLDCSSRCGDDRWTNADVANTIHDYPIYDSPHRIYAITREQLHRIRHFDIRRWETEAPSHLVPGDDDSLDGIGTTEESCGAFHLSLRDGRADNRAGARFPIDHHWSNNDESAPSIVKDSRHHLSVAGATLSEVEVSTYYDNTCIQAADKDLAYEVLSRQSLKTSREILKDDRVDPGLLSKFNALAVRRQETLDAPSRQFRVPSECINNGSKRCLVATIDKFPDNPLMTNVKAVEGPNGDNGGNPRKLDRR
jgi:hypothetical protein